MAKPIIKNEHRQLFKEGKTNLIPMEVLRLLEVEMPPKKEPKKKAESKLEEQ